MTTSKIAKNLNTDGLYQRLYLAAMLNYSSIKCCHWAKYARDKRAPRGTFVMMEILYILTDISYYTDIYVYTLINTFHFTLNVN